WKSGASESRSQPLSSMPPRLAAPRARNRRRGSRTLRMIVLDKNGKSPGDHRAQLVHRSGQKHHRDMHENEQRNQAGRDEMDRPRGLTSAKQVDEPGQDRIHPRRHGEAGQDHQRQQHADHAQIGQLLEGIIMARLLAMRKFQPKVVESVLEKGPWPQLLPAGQEIAPEMSAGNSGHEISQEVRDEQPSKKEMPPPPQSEIAPAWKRSPPWKGAPYSVTACI